MASMSSYRAWTGLSKSGILSVSDLDFLRDDIFETLRDPALPAPALRRETRCFATTIQDLIGNELYFKEEQMGFDFPEEAEEILRALDDHSLKLLEDFSEQHDKNLMTCMRWMVRTKSSATHDLSLEDMPTAPESNSCSLFDSGSSCNFGNRPCSLPVLEIAHSLRKHSPPKPWLLQYYKVLKQTITAYCDITTELLISYTD